jgi:hypothetical protein
MSQRVSDATGRDWLRRVRCEISLSLATDVKDAAEPEGDAAKLTPMNVLVTPKTTRHRSKKMDVGKR